MIHFEALGGSHHPPAKKGRPSGVAGQAQAAFRIRPLRIMISSHASLRLQDYEAPVKRTDSIFKTVIIVIASLVLSIMSAFAMSVWFYFASWARHKFSPEYHDAKTPTIAELYPTHTPMLIDRMGFAYLACLVLGVLSLVVGLCKFFHGRLVLSLIYCILALPAFVFLAIMVLYMAPLAVNASYATHAAASAFLLDAWRDEVKDTHGSSLALCWIQQQFNCSGFTESCVSSDDDPADLSQCLTVRLLVCGSYVLSSKCIFVSALCVSFQVRRLLADLKLSGVLLPFPHTSGMPECLSYCVFRRLCAAPSARVVSMAFTDVFSGCSSCCHCHGYFYGKRALRPPRGFARASVSAVSRWTPLR